MDDSSSINKQMVYEKELIEITVPGTKKLKGHTEYQINLVSSIPQFPAMNLKVYRRYSQILKLHKKIYKIFPILPEFPKKNWFRRMSPDVIEFRRRCFQIYFTFILDFILRNSLQDCAFAKEIFDFFSQ